MLSCESTVTGLITWYMYMYISQHTDQENVFKDVLIEALIQDNGLTFHYNFSSCELLNKCQTLVMLSCQEQQSAQNMAYKKSTHSIDVHEPMHSKRPGTRLQGEKAGFKA